MKTGTKIIKDVYDLKWIIEKSGLIIENYPEGLTMRALHYRLHSVYGMINDLKHYKRTVAAMTKARWDGIVDMDAFIDRERDVYGETNIDEKNLDEEINTSKSVIESRMEYYKLNRWSNQKNFIEVWIEKKSLQSAFEKPCDKYEVALAPCKGYPSLTFIHDALKRFNYAKKKGKNITILYFGDYDPSGEDIPQSIENNLIRMGILINVERIALNPEQIKKYDLPGVPAKETDTRTANWDGENAVELDAVEPHLLQKICEKAISNYFDEDNYEILKEKEECEQNIYKAKLHNIMIGEKIKNLESKIETIKKYFKEIYKLVNK